MQNALAVDEALIEAPAPGRAHVAAAGPVEGAAQGVQMHDASLPRPAAEGAAHVEQPHPAHVAGQTNQAGQDDLFDPMRADGRAQSFAVEIVREHRDAIEESVIFDVHEAQHPQQLRSEYRVPPASPPPNAAQREPPDPRQAEAVLARIRALTKRKDFGTQRSDIEVRADMRPGLPLEAPLESLHAETRAMSAMEPPEVKLQTAQEFRIARTDALRKINNQPGSARHGDDNSVQLSIGSIVVHVEPEAATLVAPPIPRQQSASNASAEARAADSRWKRSYLDRN